MKTRILSPDELTLLEPHLAALADYHNRVAEVLPGIYPIVPFATALADTREMLEEGMAQAEILYDDDDRIAGYCVVHRHGNTGDIDWIYVRDDLRGQGWGKRLLENALTYLRTHGVELVDLELVRGNPAKGFYQAVGFVTRMEVMTIQLTINN